MDRGVLRILEETETSIPIGELARRLANERDDETYGDVHQSLYRDRLQLLDAAGSISFDMSTGMVYPAWPRVEDGAESAAAHVVREAPEYSTGEYATLLVGSGVVLATLGTLALDVSTVSEILGVLSGVAVFVGVLFLSEFV
ncbi:MAG: hypothetical protein ACQETI_12455 [Halobacteriota archaeon]